MAINKATNSNIKLYASHMDEGILKWGGAEDYAIRLESGILKWTPAISSIDVPDETNVRDGVIYAGGRVGTLGQIDENSLTISEDIRANALFMIKSYLPTWSLLDYTYELDKNEGRGNIKRYGVQVRDLIEEEGVGNRLIDREYALILRDKFSSGGKTDALMDIRSGELKAMMEELRRRFDASNAGNWASVMGSNKYSEEIIEIGDDNTITCTMTYNVQYNVNNK